MARRAVSLIALVCLLTWISFGCYTGRMIESTELAGYDNYKIRRIVTHDGEVIEFSRGKPAVLDPAEETLVGFPVSRSTEKDATSGRARRRDTSRRRRSSKPEQEECRVALSDVHTLYLEKVNPVTTTITVIAVSAVVLVTAAAISCAANPPEIHIPEDEITSCPFVYSFDGEYYVFEGAPYIGSMCEALERTDVLRLGQLVPFENEYRLQVLNGAVETEHIDEFTLVVADHEPGLELALDARGGVHTVADRQQPLSATDQRGRDWRRWLAERDFLFWEGDAFSMDPEGTAGLRDTLFFSFRIPPSAEQAKLLVSGGHTQWAVGLERALLDLWGSEVDSLYERFSNPAHRARFLEWVAREEMADLAVRVRTADGWRIADRVSLGGPLGSRECVAILGLEAVVGETLEVALTPPAGVWRINAVEADFSPDAPVEMQEVAASSAIGPGGEDLRDALRADDGAYFTQPEAGTRALLAFPEPPREPARARTVLAKVTGYYAIHLNAQGPAQTDEIGRLERDPGYAGVFALRQHREWQEGLTVLTKR